jgi:hypothetical protein
MAYRYQAKAEDCHACAYKPKGCPRESAARPRVARFGRKCGGARVPEKNGQRGSANAVSTRVGFFTASKLPGWVPTIPIPVRPAEPLLWEPFDHQILLTQKLPSPFVCNIYAPPRKCCKQKTYVQPKPFKCNIYAKPGVTSGLHPSSQISPLFPNSVATIG